MKTFIFVIFTTFFCTGAFALDMTDDLRSFASNMETCYGVPEEKVESWLQNASFDSTAILRMDRQTESKKWGFYKPLFVTDKKALGGFEFYMDYEDALKRAEAEFGVSRYVITAILGVETDYGRFKLQHRALDTLATLAFYYPRRASFFSKELTSLFILSDEEDSDPSAYMSSYAGAVGLPQFMPSNIKRYGVDFDGDGKINLVDSPEDAIASIARYLRAHGYRMNRPTAVGAGVEGEEWKKYAGRGMRPKFTVKELSEAGVMPSLNVRQDRKASFYELKLSDDQSEYWLFFDNFYAITRYNPSIRYALAVTLLSFEIKSMVQDADF
ncbi:MAG: lytic murein transglycosylase B [Deferribacterales bacterium]